MLQHQMLIPIAAATVAVLFMSSPATGGGFIPNCDVSPCPSVTWSDAGPGQIAAFQLTRSSSSGSNNNWVSFAFSQLPSMVTNQTVVDCYDLNGTITIGTSRNVMGDNSDYQADSAKVTARSAARIQGVYACAFNMTLPIQPMYTIIAEGNMKAASAPPKKLYHGSRKWISAPPSNLSSTRSPATVTPSKTSGGAAVYGRRLLITVAVSVVIATATRFSVGR